MGLEPEEFFSSTLVVFWAVAFIPWMLRERQYDWLALSFLLLLAVRFWLAWDPQEILRNLVISFGVMCLATLGGIIMYLYEKRKEETKDEGIDE